MQGLHDGLQRCAQGLALPLGPAEPQPLGRDGKGLVKAHLLAYHAVLKAVRQVDLLCHQGIAVSVGQKTRLGRRTGELPFRKAQHKYIVRRIQTHFAGACQHHGVQRLRDVPKVRRAQQQAEQVLIFRKGHALPAQQVGHFVQQLHHHVPLPGRFLCRRDAPGRADGLDLCGLLFLGSQLLQAEIQRPADLLRVGPTHPAAQAVHRRHQQLTGLFGIGQRFPVLFGQLVLAKAPGAFCKACPPRRRIGRPGVGIVFQGTDLRLTQSAQAGLGQNGQVLGHVRAAHKGQQCPHRRGRGAELRRGGFITVERDVCHAELVPDGGAIAGDVAADHRDLSAAHALPHQAADGRSGAAGFFFPAGGRKQPHLRRRRRHLTGTGLQQFRHSGKAGGVPVAQVCAQKLRHCRFGPVFAGQLAQLRRHLLCAGKQPHLPRHHGGTVVTQGHRDRGQRRQHRAHQPLFGGVEGVKFVNEHLPLPQKVRQLAPGKGSFQPGRRQLQPVRGVHTGARQQRFVALKDQRQFAQLAALGAAIPGQLCQLCAGKPGTFQLVDGLGRHLAEGCTAAVAVVVMHVVLQLFQCAAHQHGPACVRKGLHCRTALGGEDALGQTGKGKAFHHAGKRIAQFPVDAALCAGGELFRHQQDAVPACLGPGTDAGIEQRRFAAAGAA